MNEEQCVTGEQIWVSDPNEQDDVCGSPMSLWFWASMGSFLGFVASLFIRTYAIAHDHVALQYYVAAYSLPIYAGCTFFFFVMAILFTVRDRTE